MSDETEVTFEVTFTIRGEALPTERDLLKFFMDMAPLWSAAGIDMKDVQVDRV